MPEAIWYERVGYEKVMESRRSDDHCLSFVSAEVCGGGRGTYAKRKILVSRSIEGSEKDFAGLYMVLSLLLVSQLLGVRKRERS